MPYPTETKHYSSAYPNAPQIFADPGGYVGFLDAILVTGYGIAALGDIVVTDGVAVVSVPAGHSLRTWQVAAHAGAGHAGLNGEFRVIAASGNTYTVEVVGVPNGSYSGGSTRVAPLGFEISYQSGHKRVYRSKDTARRNKVSLFVDDSNTVAGWDNGGNKALTRARMVCDVVDIASFTTLDTTWWPKSAEVSGVVARPWLLAGDALGFYTSLDVGSNGLSIAANHFVQLPSLAMGDLYATLLEGANSGTDNVTDSRGLGAAGAAMTQMPWGTRRIARPLDQSGVAVAARYYGTGVLCVFGGRGWLASGAHPIATSSNTQGPLALARLNPADNSLTLARILAVHTPTSTEVYADATVRAYMPGLFSVPAVGAWSMSPSLQAAPVGMAPGRLLALPATVGDETFASGTPISPRLVGGYFVDVVSNWR